MILLFLPPSPAASPWVQFSIFCPATISEFRKTFRHTPLTHLSPWLFAFLQPLLLSKKPTKNPQVNLQNVYKNIYTYIYVDIYSCLESQEMVMGLGNSTHPDFLSCQLDAQMPALKNRFLFFKFIFKNINPRFKSQITAPGIITIIALKWFKVPW